MIREHCREFADRMKFAEQVNATLGVTTLTTNIMYSFCIVAGVSILELRDEH